MSELEECRGHLSMVRGSRASDPLSPWVIESMRDAIIWLLERQVERMTTLGMLNGRAQKETPDSQKPGAEGGNCK